MTDSMEISQESQAPSMETSNQPPPIHNPSPPIASSSSPPPSNPQPHINNLVNRKILKPAIPSKRLMQEKTSPKTGHNSDHANAFLPQELAEIIAIRQNRERAWHARLMICTTVISNVDSTLASFKEDVEKEEVVAFKAYLRLAIANYAAADSSPAPPIIPTHSQPSKSNGSGSDKEKNALRKVAIAIPQNIIPRVAEKTWAIVTRNGQKKAQSPSITTTDTRFFVRLPQEHEWRKLSPAGIREVIVKKLAISPALFGKIKPVNSGFALCLCSTVARKTILNAGKATNWVSVIVPTILSKIRKVQGEIEASSAMLTDEIERVCSLRPAHVKLYGRKKAEAPHRTWTAFFTKAPNTTFRVFDESGIARPLRKQQPI
ncbi:hypothetical protein EPUL_002931 [Erysiphe pulchra]|uniref:Uncharacterized protein n=1 Tax=Erysiphe pulchra TaxID=225359 RepID=A0A2S4PQ05_9PEZI|nr:hypothetical protein EPUL_002931 [Erysiphe pulchra]